MYKIVKKEILNPSVVLMDIYAPDIARSCKAGQFIVLRIDEVGERIPLTIADFFPEEGLVRIVTQSVGYTSAKLNRMEEGDSLLDFIGPLGQPSEIENYGTVLCVCGGLGIAPMFPIARELKKAGNKVITVVGARSDQLLIWEDVLGTVSDEVHVATDDGSRGVKGLVTDVARGILEREKVDHAWAIGPVIMMKFTAKLTEEFNVPTIVSMNPIMVDGTGMCGACRLEVGGKTKFACVDGPEFDGHQVNWDLSMKRMNIYKAKEQIALEKAQKEGF